MNPNDLRVIKTKRALSQSLFTLLDQKAFSSITVNMICEEALVHRTTFYKHFYDKYDLLTYLITNLAKDYFEKDIQERIEKPFQSLSEFFDCPDENINIKQRNDQEFIETVTSIFIQKLRQDIIDNQDKLEVPNGVPIEIVARIFDSAITAIGEWNYDHFYKDAASALDQKPDPKALDKIFRQMINIKIKQQ